MISVSHQKIGRHILPVIVLAQFAGTSLWFAGNAVAGDLQKALHLDLRAIGDITSAVQFGFISGTLLFAFFSVADRFSPSKVFLGSALAGALFNLGVVWFAGNLWELLLLRFLTGFFLAGIYPVGMKIAADWHEKGLGKALGYLVGALVLGTAFPHLLKALTTTLPWSAILVATSLLAAMGGIVLFFTVGDGPYRKPAPRFQWNAIPRVFGEPSFRAAAFGYFGHMWELYALWAFIPLALGHYVQTTGMQTFQVPLWSFFIIAAGALGCVWGGYQSMKKGSAWVAMLMLTISGLCCILSPLLYHLPGWLFLPILIVWGFGVVGDSPQFSTLVAQTAPADLRGTALTIVNCIGFAITIGSIQLLTALRGEWSFAYLFLLLAPGPVFGWWQMREL